MRISSRYANGTERNRRDDWLSKMRFDARRDVRVSVPGASVSFSDGGQDVSQTGSHQTLQVQHVRSFKL